MADDLIIRTPLLENQNQNQSDVTNTGLTPPPPSPPRTNPQTTSPTSSPNGFFLSLQSCCPPSVLLNRSLPGHIRPLRYPGASQPTIHEVPSNGLEPGHLQGGSTNIFPAATLPNESADNVRGIVEDTSGDVVLALTNDLPVIGEGSTDGSLPTSAELLSYRLGIVPMTDYKVSIRSEADLKELWKLVLERREIQKFLENTIKSGREHSKILGFVGSMVLLFSTMIDAALDEHLSNTKKAVILSVFLVIIIVYMTVSNAQLHYIYDPALSDAQLRYENVLVMTNIAKRKLLVPISKPRVASSIGKEWELQKKFDDYCEEIQKPLNVRWNRCLSFFELNSIALALLMAFIVKGNVI